MWSDNGSEWGNVILMSQSQSQSWKQPWKTIKSFWLSSNQPLLSQIVFLTPSLSPLTTFFPVKYLHNTREFMIHTTTQLCRRFSRYQHFFTLECGVMVQKKWTLNKERHVRHMFTCMRTLYAFNLRSDNRNWRKRRKFIEHWLVGLRC